MIAKERRNRIQEIIAKEGVVETSQLAELLEVSVETIRPDFPYTWRCCFPYGDQTQTRSDKAQYTI